MRGDGGRSERSGYFSKLSSIFPICSSVSPFPVASDVTLICYGLRALLMPVEGVANNEKDNACEAHCCHSSCGHGCPLPPALLSDLGSCLRNCGRCRCRYPCQSCASGSFLSKVRLTIVVSISAPPTKAPTTGIKVTGALARRSRCRKSPEKTRAFTSRTGGVSAPTRGRGPGLVRPDRCSNYPTHVRPLRQFSAR